MGLAVSLGIGLALVFLGWLVVRIEAHAKLGPGVILDGLVPLSIYLLLTIIADRPFFAGVVSFCLCACFAGADYFKRRALSEPILVADFIATADILRHPRLCLIFPRPVLVLICAAVVVTASTLLFLAEAPAAYMPWWADTSIILACMLAVWAAGGPLLGITARLLKKLELTGRPRHDARKAGSFAMLVAYGFLARAERGARRAAVPPPQTEAAGPAAPIVLVQCESFFDARRLHPAIAQELLLRYDACRAQSHQWGRLAVPARGANTVRTEFAVLSGLPSDAAGFDRFNPYYRFARASIASLAWRLRAAGYRTICIHPFDRHFYGRDKVFAPMGFDEFLGEEAFGGAERKGRYVCDDAVADVISRLLKTAPPKTFIFAITMENHGPWSPAPDCRRDFAPALPTIAQGAMLKNYLNGVASTDAMTGALAETLRARGDDGVLALYGDHLPSLADSFTALEFYDRRSDYLIWRPGGGMAPRRDIAAHALAAAVWRAAIAN